MERQRQSLRNQKKFLKARQQALTARRQEYVDREGMAFDGDGMQDGEGMMYAGQGMQAGAGKQSFPGMLKSEWISLWNFVEGSLKMKLILLLCALLLIGTVTKTISDKVLYRQMDIVDAFAASEAGYVESKLQITADYGTAFLTEHDKQALINYLAGSLGVRIDGEIEYRETDAGQIYSYTKKAKQAATTLKAITLREDTSRTYLYVELSIYQDDAYDVLNYRDIILETLEDMGVTQAETTLQLLGAYDGKLAMSEWNRLADGMIKKLSGKIVYENRDEDLYTIYAYSGLLAEYITVEKKRINMQVAVRYEEDTNRTVVYLASPIIRGEW